MRIAFSNLSLASQQSIPNLSAYWNGIPSRRGSPTATTSGYYKEEPKPNRFLYMDLHLCFSNLIGFSRVLVNRQLQKCGDDYIFVFLTIKHPGDF